MSIKEHYQAEAVARSYDRERFSSLSGRVFDRLEKHALRKMLAWIRQRTREPQVLDIPCGTGRITELWLKDGVQVTGADISPAMIAVAQEKCGKFGDRIAWRILDLELLDLPDDAFDLVSCIRLFHHLDTSARARILAELARVSSRYVLVNVSYSSSWHRLRRAFKRRLGQGVSRASSTADEIAEEAATAGLKLVRRRWVLPLVSEDMLLLFEKF